MEYCEHHRGEPLPATDSDANQDETRKRTTDIGEWDQKFITVDQEMLFEIILAANYLDIKSLLYVLFYSFLSDHHAYKYPISDVGCKTVANMIKGKTPEEIRKLFNIVNDFTPEEEVSYRKIPPIFRKLTMFRLKLRKRMWVLRIYACCRYLICYLIGMGRRPMNSSSIRSGFIILVL